ncbi:type II secretion system protein GspD [Veillonella agrestimuris]|uniref:type II secretion system protein GspD n=1 Tax=Veillonella agrestimuris TaxID=2941340 RepID=UPI00203FC601|nr:type II and III secretion system protein [Veillonella agrestimuris]
MFRRRRIAIYIMLCISLWMPLVAVGEEPKELTKAPIEMTVKNVALQDLVRTIGKSYNLNIMGLETLRGSVTGTIQGTTPEVVLQELSRMYHFDIVERNNILIISNDGKETDGRHVSIIEPAMISAQTVVDALKTSIPNDKISIHKDTNQIILNSTNHELVGAQRILEALDRKAPQVRLEATVMAIEQSYIKESGLKWSWLSLTGHGPDSTHSYGAITFGKTPEGEAYRFFVKPELSAMERSGRAAVIATPSIMALNGEKAHILIGERIPIVEEVLNDGERKSSVRYEDVGIRLDYTPVITKEGTIDATIRAEVSSPILVSELKAYKITTRQASTRVRMEPGETLVIGGLMDNRNQKQVEKIPLLGDIPLLGKLFRHSRKTKDTVEMVILVKTTVV